MHVDHNGQVISRTAWLHLLEVTEPLGELRTDRLVITTEYQGLEHGVWLTRTWVDGGRARGRLISKERSADREAALDAFLRATELVQADPSELDYAATCSRRRRAGAR